LTTIRSNSDWVKTARPFTGFSPHAVVVKRLFFELQWGKVVQPFDCTNHKVIEKLGMTFHIFPNKGNKQEKWQNGAD